MDFVENGTSFVEIRIDSVRNYIEIIENRSSPEDFRISDLYDRIDLNKFSI